MTLWMAGAVLAAALLTGPGRRAAIATMFARELLGTVLMVFCTFTPGPCFGHLGGFEATAAFFAGLLACDYIAGGPFVNPAVAAAFFAAGKLRFEELALVVAAQMAGGVLAFPLLQSAARPYSVTIGGPSVAAWVDVDTAVRSEAAATFLLVTAVFALCTTWIGEWWKVKHPILAAVIIALCKTFTLTGAHHQGYEGGGCSGALHTLLSASGPCARVALCARPGDEPNAGHVLGPLLDWRLPRRLATLRNLLGRPRRRRRCRRPV
jgi:hypothetical protein